jgi:hypothetical protein
VDKNFTEVDEFAPSLPGLIQRLDDIIKIQFETREQGDVAEFDFIGLSCRDAIDHRNGIMELHDDSPQKGRGYECHRYGTAYYPFSDAWIDKSTLHFMFDVADCVHSKGQKVAIPSLPDFAQSM